MPYLDDLFSDTASDPWTTLLPAMRNRSRFQQLPEEEEPGLLRKLGGAALSPLRYLFETLDKPGAAVRGLLAGQPSALLNLIPFSDTLDITHPEERVSGQQLLRSHDLIDNEDSWANWLAGMGTEIVTDPLAAVSLGKHAVTDAGSIAAKLGIMPRSGSARRLGFDVLASDMARMGPQEFARVNQTARETLGRTLNVAPLEMEQQFLQQTGRPLRPRPLMSDVATRQLLEPGVGDPLTGLFGIGRPWWLGGGEPAAVFGAGEGGEALMRGIGDTASRLNSGLRMLPGVAPVEDATVKLWRAGKGAFSPETLGTVRPEQQAVAAGTIRPEMRRLGAIAGEQETAWREAVDAIRAANPNVADDLLAQQLRQAGEGMTHEIIDQSGQRLRQPITYTPGVEALGQDIRQKLDALPQRLAAYGIDPKELGDYYADYMARFLNQALKTQGGGAGVARRVFGPSTASDISRASAYRDIPYGTSYINEAFNNPAWSGAGRTLSPVDVQKGILADFMTALPDVQNRVRTGFIDPITGMQTAASVRDVLGTVRAGLDNLPVGVRQKVYRQLKALADTPHAGFHQSPDQFLLAVQQFAQNELPYVAERGFKQDMRGKAKLLEAELAQARPEFVANKTSLFNPDPVADLAKRLEMAAGAEARAQGLHELVASEMRPEAAFLAQGRQPGDLTGLQDFFAKSPYGREKGTAALDYLSQITGLSRDELGAYRLPRDVAEEAMKAITPFSAPQAVSTFVQAYDTLLNTTKTYLTSLFPAFKTRNFATGSFNIMMDGAWRPEVLSDINTARRIASAQAVTAEEKQLAREMYAQGVALRGRGMAADVAGSTVAGGRQIAPAVTTVDPTPFAEKAGQAAKDFFLPGPGKRNPLDVSTFGPVVEARKLDNSIEDILRGWHYVAKRRLGFSPEAAATAVRRSHFAYQDLALMDPWMKRLVPFWMFSKNNAAMVVDQLLTKPGTYGAASRLALGGQQPGEFTPSYIGEGAAVAMPGAPAGFQRYLSSLGLPLEDELVSAGTSLLGLQPGRAAEKLLGQAAPLPKMLIEGATGRQLYSGRDLADLRPTLTGRLGGLLDENSPVARWLTQAIAYSPGSRFATTLDKAVDERKDPALRALNLLTGVRVTDVDTEKAAGVEGRKQLEQLLKGSGKFREFVKVYPDRNQVENLAPGEVAGYLLYQSLEREAQRAALQKRAAAGDAEAAKQLAAMERAQLRRK